MLGGVFRTTTLGGRGCKEGGSRIGKERLAWYNTVISPQLTPQGPLQSHPTYLAEAGFYGPALTSHWVQPSCPPGMGVWLQDRWLFPERTDSWECSAPWGTNRSFSLFSWIRGHSTAFITCAQFNFLKIKLKGSCQHNSQMERFEVWGFFPFILGMWFCLNSPGSPGLGKITQLPHFISPVYQWWISYLVLKKQMSQNRLGKKSKQRHQGFFTFSLTSESVHPIHRLRPGC